MKRKLKVSLAFILSLLMLLPCVMTAGAAATALMPENDITGYDYPLSYVSEPFTVPAANKNVGRAVRNAVSGTVSVPAAFDLRTVSGSLPAVRDQNPYGTCWAFSSIVAAETSMIVNGLADNTVDMSELNLVYNTYRNVEDPLGNFTGDYNVITGGKTMMDVGGNGQLATISLARWGGVTDESVMPYNQGLFACGYDYPNDYAGEMDVSHLQNAYWLNLSEEAQAIKSFVMSGHAVGMAYWEDHLSVNSATYAYYQNSAFDTNHAVAIVGWDDNFSRENFNEAKRPATDGAWLIRNSWGSDYADGGYFWLSYADTSLNLGTAYVYDFESAENYDRNYQYDGSAGMSYLSIIDRPSMTGANVFTAHSNETLRAVSFMNPRNTNVNYDVKIYLNPNDSTRPNSGTLVSSVSGNETYCGYHTVTLTETVTLAANDVFAVVITLTDTAGKDLWIAYEDSYDYGWMKTVSAYEAGQSFMSYNDGNSWTDFGTARKGNIRIKAFTDVQGVNAPFNLKAVLNESAVALTWSAAAGAQSYDIYKKGENETEYTSLTNVTDCEYTYTPDLSAGLTVLYKVKAVSAAGNSDYSKAAGVSLPVTRHLQAFDMSCNDEYTEFTIQKDTTAQIITDPYPAAATDKLIAFLSENTKIATVSKTGLVTAVGYGNITLTGVARDGNIDRTLLVRIPQTINVTSLDGMQSAHNYTENLEQKYVYTKVGADSVSVTFSSDTKTTVGRDNMKIYNSAGVLQGTYSGTQLAGKTITVQGDTFTLLFETDKYGGDYGFKATAITYTGGELDTATLTQYINEAKALTQSNYTPASWTVLSQAVSAGEALFTDPGTTQDDIDNAAAAVRTAIDSLADYVNVTDVSISAADAIDGVLKVLVPAGESMDSVGVQLNAVINPAGATYKSVAWTSSDFFVTVNDSGYVNATYDCAAYSTITLTVTDDFNNTYTDDILAAFMHYDAQKVVLSETSLSLRLMDDTHTITARVTDNDGNDADLYDVTWTSDNPGVVTVSDGVITIIGEGTAKVRATADFGGAYAECNVTVGDTHVHNYVGNVVAPTCEAQGYTEYTCSCGDSYIADYVPATGHIAVIRNAAEPTCTLEGYTGDTYCSVCETNLSSGTIIAALGHTGGTATCCAKAVCTRCSEAYGEFNPANHSGATQLRDNIAATCTLDGYTGNTYCTGCNTKIADGETIKAFGHTEVIRNATEPTCTLDGYTGDTYCSVCETKLSSGTVIAALGHTGGTATCCAKAVCTRCSEAYGEFNPANHSGATQVRDNIAATCTLDGYTGDTYCTGCNTKIADGETIKALGHTEVIRNAAEPTCTLDGYTGDTYCSGCETKLSSGTIIAALGHTGGTATCCAKAVCTRCSEAYGEFNPANHSGATQLRDNIAATCTLDGYTGNTYCTGCNTKIANGETIKAFAHTEVIRNATEPTCTLEGYTGDTYCSVCETKLSSGTVIAALGHTVVQDASQAPSCTLPGKTAGSHCSVCSEILIAQQDIAPLGHTYNGGTVTPPTCTTGGNTVYVCTVCGDSYTADEIAALGHADADSDGICDICGENLRQNCSCKCHATSGFSKFIYKIMLFFWKIFGMNKTCACGAQHY